MNTNIQIVAQLSKVKICNQHNHKMEQMYNRREELMNILSYVDFSKLCHFIDDFPLFNHNDVKEGVTLSPSYSPRAIKRRTKH